MELLERDRFLDELATVLRQAAQGDGVTVLVNGEAGIGKTSLVRELARRNEHSARILWGACDALFTPRPLGPLHDAAPQMGQQVAALLDSHTDRAKLFAAVLDDLRRGPTPTLLVFEDVHWADEATLDLLKYLGRRIQRTHTLLIATYRDDEVDPHHPLCTVLGDLATSAATHRLTLAPLSVNAVRALVAERPLDPVALHHQTDGNPFFVTEVIASGASAIPPTVRDAVLARAARLSPSARAVLEAAAVIGPRVEPWLLSNVTGAEAQAAEECLAIGVLLVKGDMLAFRHELARQTILEAISPQQRLVLHRLVLDAIKASPATRHDFAQLAHHTRGAGDQEAVLEYAPAAAQRASALGAHRQAAAHYQVALGYASVLPAEARSELLDAYAIECELADQMVEAERAQQAALHLWRELGRREKEGRALRRLSEIVFKQYRNLDMERYAAEAISVLETLPPSQELAMAYSHMSRLLGMADRYGDAVHWGSRAIELAEQLGDVETLAHALCTIGIQEVRFDERAEGRAKLERSLRLLLAQGLHNRAAWAFCNLANGLLYIHDYMACVRYLDEGVAYCAQNDLDFWRVILLGIRAQAKFEQGRWDEAEQDCQVAERLWSEPMEEVMGAHLRLQIRRGDPIPSEALDAIHALARKSPLFYFVCNVAALLAEAAWLRGNLAQCRAESESVFEIARQRNVSKELGDLSYWMWRAGALTQPPPNAAEPYAMQISGNWQNAATMGERFGCPYEQALALMDGDEAVQLAALEIFDRLRARPAAEIVRQKLQAVPARRLEKEKFGGLTEREREVAALIAQGKSNREIAEAMVVSVKTVETYVTRILNKLGFDSRVQIATWAIEQGLTTTSAGS